MVRIARNSNSAVLMPGVDKVMDLTNEFTVAIQHASTILGWFENLAEHEMPPRWMWAFPDELEEWFEEVRLARKQGVGGDDDDWGGMVENEWDPFDG